MRIGEVHAQLRRDFPDIELSKIRYYEDKGLVKPARSRKGYRLYSDRDVACLREAIRLAQEEFVPLRVVRLRLIEQGLLDDDGTTSAAPRAAPRSAAAPVVSLPAPSPVRAVPAARASAEPVEDARRETPAFYTVAEFLETAGISDAVANQLIAAGLLSTITMAGQTVLSADEVEIAVLCAMLMARGVDVRALGAIRRVAQREIGIIDDLTEPLRRPGSTLPDRQVRAITADVAREVTQLRGALGARELREYLGN